MRIFDSRGRSIGLGRELGRGGEGAVWEVTGDDRSVAKVYHSPVDPDKVGKLEAMARLVRPEFVKISAWPTDTLHDAPRGRLIGVLMPKVVGHSEIHQLYSPAERKIHYPKSDWAFLAHVAMNCAAAFETVHNAGHVIGDVNPGGVMVSHQATVHLIDCDSFQIRDGSKTFLCTVGVPQYTPPELQGATFHGVVRTQSHDCFGLAVLVFHLLFMGRHPFAGRFLGRGDMPIEKAISEGRFAFGRSAAAVQMDPPPFSLGLQALSPQLAGLFEDAFASPALTAAARPSARDWHQALSVFKTCFRQCANDPGHKYAAHLPSCPWCEVIRQGGPNFFVSIQVVAAGVRYELPTFDAAALWAQIARVSPPPAQQPAISPHVRPLTPVPLPEQVQDILTSIRVVRIAFFVMVAVFAASFLVGPTLQLAGAILTALLGTAWVVLVLFPSYKKEMDRRRGAHRTLRAAIASEHQRWDAMAREYGRRFALLRSELESAADEVGRIPVAFQQERSDLEARKRDAQFQNFLESQFIRNHKIEKIGPGRLATLLSYGIETAADVSESRLTGIPGFGPAIISRLVAWRGFVVASFRFDATQAVPPTQMQALFLKHRQRQLACEAKLKHGRERLESVTSEAARNLAPVHAGIERLVLEFRQAEANLRASRGVSWTGP